MRECIYIVHTNAHVIWGQKKQVGVWENEAGTTAETGGDGPRSSLLLFLFFGPFRDSRNDEREQKRGEIDKVSQKCAEPRRRGRDSS